MLWSTGPTFALQMRSLLGTGVFNSDGKFMRHIPESLLSLMHPQFNAAGDMWKFHRGMTRPFFNKDRISHFDIFERYVYTKAC